MTRNRSKFTRQQVDAFQANPYTYRISESTIRFTLEFKKEFWKRYQAGQSPSRILTDLGYDVDAQYGTISEKRRHPRRGCMKAMRPAGNAGPIPQIILQSRKTRLWN